MKAIDAWRLAAAIILLAAPVSVAAEDRSLRRISIDLVGVPVEDVFRSFAEELGVPLKLDPALIGSLSLRLDNVRVRTAIDAACDSVGCTYVIVEGEKPRLQVRRSNTDEARGRGQVTESPITDRGLMPVTLSLRDAKLGDVMSTFARILSCELKLEVDPSAILTIELENVTARQALERIGGLLKVDMTLIPRRPPADDCLMKVTPAPDR